MDNLIIIIILALIIGLAVFYILRAKKKGNKCIGCPYSSACNSKNKKECSYSDNTERF